MIAIVANVIQALVNLWVVLAADVTLLSNGASHPRCHGTCGCRVHGIRVPCLKSQRTPLHHMPVLSLTKQNCASANFGSRVFTAAALCTLTLFRRGRIIHGATYFKDAGQRSPVRDVATIVQYDTIMACSSHMALGRKRSHGTARCVRPFWNGALSTTDKQNRETLDKLYI